MQAALISVMKFGNMFIMNTLILAGSLSLSGIASADNGEYPIIVQSRNVHVSILNTSVEKISGITTDHTNECSAEFGNARADHSVVHLTIGSGKAVSAGLSPEGKPLVQYDSAMSCQSSETRKFENFSGHLNPSMPQIRFANAKQAQKFLALYNTPGVSISINDHQCLETSGKCSLDTFFVEDGGYTVPSYGPKQISVAFSDGKSMPLNKYFGDEEADDLKDVIKGFANVFRRPALNHSPSTSEVLVKPVNPPAVADLLPASTTATNIITN
jgi:hypothetical protein